MVQGRLVIGTLPFSTGMLLAASVDRVLRSHPGLGITVIDGTYDQLTRQLRFAEIDLVVELAGRRVGIEIKFSATPQVSRGFWHSLQDLGLHRAFVLAPGQSWQGQKG